MTVGELRQALDGVLDSTIILIESVDHSYRPLGLHFGTARYVKAEGYYCEDSGDDEDHRPEEKVIDAMIGY